MPPAASPELGFFLPSFLIFIPTRFMAERKIYQRTWPTIWTQDISCEVSVHVCLFDFLIFFYTREPFLRAQAITLAHCCVTPPIRSTNAAQLIEREISPSCHSSALWCHTETLVRLFDLSEFPQWTCATGVTLVLSPRSRRSLGLIIKTVSKNCRYN